MEGNSASEHALFDHVIKINERGRLVYHLMAKSTRVLQINTS